MYQMGVPSGGRHFIQYICVRIVIGKRAKAIVGDPPHQSNEKAQHSTKASKCFHFRFSPTLVKGIWGSCDFIKVQKCGKIFLSQYLPKALLVLDKRLDYLCKSELFFTDKNVKITEKKENIKKRLLPEQSMKKRR